ncbi:hypothetical protein ACSU1N_01270 [Thermogladius sp. 4427co]|uniref:hypothetical protein n=1 Tax=Thermogladius sp. 4427co TaxID=3450718 RepID=UPI003F7996C3
MVQVYSLRCSHCGAPLPPPKPGEEYVRCEYCGYWNRVDESKKYTEALLEEVKKWVSSIIPRQVITSTVADMVARHHLFQAYVLPRITPILASAKADLYKSLSKSLVDIRGLFTSPPSQDPKKYFEEAVRLSSLAELAGGDEDSRMVNTLIAYYNVLAYLNNAFFNAGNENYAEAYKNMREAAEMIGLTGEARFVDRLRAAAAVYNALAEIKNRNPKSAEALLNSIENIDPAERAVFRVVREIARWAGTWFEHGRDPLEPYVKTVEYLQALQNLDRRLFEECKEGLVELVGEYSLLNTSRLGAATIKLVEGEGDYYIPFYLSKTSITFVQTGFFSKKGKGYIYNTIIPATTPVTHPPVLETGVIDSLKGKTLAEKLDSIAGTCLNSIVSRIRDSYPPPGSRFIPPFTPRKIAEELFYRYWRPYFDKYKITNIAVDVGGVIYVPGRLRAGNIEFCNGLLKIAVKNQEFIVKYVV